jgi:hypothetical protein
VFAARRACSASQRKQAARDPPILLPLPAAHTDSPAFHKSFKCEPKGDGCACTIHPTHNDGGCMEIASTASLKKGVYAQHAGDCTDTGKNYSIWPTAKKYMVTTIAGHMGATTDPGGIVWNARPQPGVADGVGGAAKFGGGGPDGVAVKGDIGIFPDMRNNMIRKVILSSGKVTTLAGATHAWGFADGHHAMFKYPARARFNEVTGGDDDREVYVTDEYNDAIRKINIDTGVTTTIAGRGGRPEGSWMDGVGADAALYRPGGMSVRGNDIYFPDKSSHCIRHLDLATRRVTTIAGQGGLTDNSKGSGQGLGIGKGHRSQGWSDGVGAAAKFHYPQDVAYLNNQLIVADGLDNLRRIDLAMYPYKVTSIGYKCPYAYNSPPNTPYGMSMTEPYQGAFWGSDGRYCASGIADGEYSPLGLARLDGCHSIVEKHGSLYLGCYACIKKFDPSTGQMTTIAGKCKTNYAADGYGDVARFKYNVEVAFQRLNNKESMIIADGGNMAIRRMTPS